DIAGCMQIIQSRASNVHSRWRKCMRPYQSTLLRQCRLISLEESASIGNAAENTRDQFRSVHQAEAKEKLVFLAEVQVQSRIKGLSIFLQNRRRGVIGK